MNKKIALSLLAMTILKSNEVFAEGPSLKITGGTSVDIAGIRQKIKKNDDKKKNSPTISIGASDIYFTAEAKTEGGLLYKWRSNVTAVPNITPFIDRNYVEVGCDSLGTFQLGAVAGSEDTMSISALNLVGGSAGMDGTFGGLYNMSSGVIGGVHILGYTKRSNKITYTTPRISGVQAGISYTPNTTRLGRGEKDGIGHDGGLYCGKMDDLFGKNNIALGLSYANTWDDFSLNIAATYVTERSRLNVNSTRINLNNVSAFQIGTSVGYKDFKVITSYINNGKSRLPKEANQILKGQTVSSENLHLGNAGRMWDIGFQYTMNAYQFGIAYFSSDRKLNKTESANSRIITMTADYKALPGLKLFAEADFAVSKTSNAAMNLSNALSANSSIDKNNGHVFLVGTRISF